MILTEVDAQNLLTLIETMSVAQIRQHGCVNAIACLERIANGQAPQSPRIALTTDEKHIVN